MQKQKSVYLSEEDLQLLKEYKEKNGFNSDSQVFSYLLRKTRDEKEELVVAIREELEKNYLPKERIKWATKVAEQNSIVMLDAINTILFALNLDSRIPVEVMPHKIISSSQDDLKQKIAHFKQMSDERKSKGK